MNGKSSVEEGDIIISFNWDCLLEVALSKTGVKWKYGLKLSERNDKFCWPEKEISLLKLHGSIDWIRFLHSMFRSGRNDKWEKLLSRDEYVICRLRSYDDDLEFEEGDYPMIHLPGEKLTEFECSEYWNSALSCLTRATEIIFIGYSLPPYDSSEQSLFRRSYSAARNEYSIEQTISVVNPAPVVVGRYVSIFGDKISYYPITFDEWLKKRQALAQ